MIVFRILLRWLLLLAPIFVGIIGVIRAQPYNDRGLHTFLLDCRMPCWQGIRPYVTTPDEALVILRSLDVVSDVGTNLNSRGGQIYWKWDLEHLPFLRETREVGYLWIKGDQIVNIYLPSFDSFMDVWLTLGNPQQVRIYFESLWGTRTVIYVLVYPDNLYVAQAVFCAADREELIHARSSVYIGALPQYPGMASFDVTLADLPGWKPRKMC